MVTNTTPWGLPICENAEPNSRRLFNEDASVFFIFIPFMKTDGGFVFPEEFGRKMTKISRYISSKCSATKQYFATDLGSATPQQATSTKSFLAENGIEMFDITAIEGFIPCDKNRTSLKVDADMSDILQGRVSNVHIECVDRNKILVCSLAGTEGFGDVIAMDVDFEMLNDLFVKPKTDRAFTYTPCHENPSIIYDMEMSMMFASRNRPSFHGEDLFEGYKKRFKKEFVEKAGSSAGTYGAWSHSTVAVDPLVDIPVEEVVSILEQPEYERYLRSLIIGLPSFEALRSSLRQLDRCCYAHPTVHHNDPMEFIRVVIANYKNRNGDYIIHGRYHSKNKETWRTAALQEAL